MVAVARARRRHALARDGAVGRRAGTGLGRTQPGTGQGPRAARPAVRGARFVDGARGSSGRRSATPGTCWRATSTLPSADELRDIFNGLARKGNATQRLRCIRCGRLYRDRMLVLAGLDLASTVENEPVLPFTTVGEHLSDLADAALGAALTVANQVGAWRRRRAAAGGHRDGQVRCARTELRQRRRRHLRRRERRRGRHPGGGRDDAVRRRRVLRSRRRVAARGQARPAGAHAGLPCRLLPAVGQDVGVPGVDEGAARGRRRRARASSTSRH